MTTLILSMFNSQKYSEEHCNKPIVKTEKTEENLKVMATGYVYFVNTIL